MRRPAESEYAPYYGGYVSQVAEEDILTVLDEQLQQLREFAAEVSSEQETYRYAPGKWSVREVFGHLGDAERVFGFRAFAFSRGEQQSLPGFDENQYVASSGSDRESLVSLMRELTYLRAGNLALLRRLDEEAWSRVGTASGHPVTVRALAFMMAGHVRHHLKVLAERYGLGG
ncbi:MAG TPA: DinB family protein [Thermoanaerobaculia bacterium]|nr:DinB family protein [Thermoanaerobaculia bacterium]